MRKLLKPYGIQFPQHHGTRSVFEFEYTQAFPDLVDNLRNIKIYAFWRDPVDRYLSAINYAKLYPRALITLFPELFGEGMECDLTKLELSVKLNDANWNKIPQKHREKIINPMDDADIFMRVFNNADNLTFMRQVEWYLGNMTILDFHDYENEARKLLTIFGADAESITIPRDNARAPFIPPTTLDERLRTTIEQYYVDDLGFNPRLNNS